VKKVRFQSIKQRGQREAGDSDREFDEGNAGNDVNGDALEFWTGSCRCNDGDVVSDIPLVSRDSNHGVGHPVNLGEERFRYDDNLHTYRVGYAGVEMTATR